MLDDKPDLQQRLVDALYGPGVRRSDSVDELADAVIALAKARWLPSGAEPVAWIVRDDPELGDYLTRSKVAAEASGKRVTALYASPQSSSQVTEERFPVTLGKVHQAIDGYVQALVERKHGGVAQDHAFGAICDALGRSTTAELDARRPALSPVKGDGQ